MDEIASIWINTRLDLSGVERDLKTLDNKNYSLKVSVDDDALTKLNKHLDLKVKHFREVNQVFQREKIKILVDDSELSKLENISKLSNKTVKIDVKVTQPSQSFLSVPITQKIDVDTSEIEKKLNSLQSQLSKQSSSSLFGNLLLAPLKLAANAMGSILQGVVFAATAPIGEDIGRGIKDGIQKESGSIIGSFEFVSKKIAENLSGAIVNALEGDADKIREVLKIVGNYSGSDLAIENRRQSRQSGKREQQNKNEGIDAIEEAKLNIVENRPQFEARKLSLVDKRNELARNYQKIQAAMSRSMDSMGGGELQKQIDKLNLELQQNLQQLLNPSSTTDFSQISKISDDLTKEIAQLSDKLGGVAERVKAKYEDFVHVLDNESKNLSSEERKLIEDLSPLTESENLQRDGIKSTSNIRKQRSNRNQNVPDIYQQVFEEVSKVSGSKGKINIPELVVNPNLSAATLGKYNPEKNQIQVTQDAYQQILSGDVTKVSEKFFEILVHELRHAAQFDFGKIDAFQQRPNIPLIKPNVPELANLGGRIELSTATTQGVSPRRVRELETDAYVFADRNAQQIRSRLAASQFQQDLGVGGGRVQNRLKIENAESLNSFKKVQQLADSYSIDITQEIEQSKQNIKSHIESINPILQRAAQVEILPLPEINQLSEELLNTYYKIVAEIQSEVSQVKQRTFEKISKAKDVPQPISQESYKQTLNEEYTSQGLRQVVKRLGVTNNTNRKKDDLIEIISQANNQQVDNILKSLGDSIKKTNFKSGASIDNVSQSISIDSFKLANKQIQVKLKELKIVGNSERQQIVESLVIDINKQINEIDKINETTNVSGKQAKQLGGLRSYFEQLRQPLSAEFIKNSSLNLPISQRNKQGELSGVGDVEEFLNNIFNKTTGKENTHETIRNIVEKFQILSAKFNVSEEKFNQLENAINERYESITNGTAKVKNIGTIARNKAMQSPDVQNDPEARFYANSANFQRSSNRFDNAESSINNRYFAALSGSPVTNNVPQVFNRIKGAVDGVKTAFANIPEPIKAAVSAFTGLYGITTVIPILQNIASESTKVAVEFESLQQKINFASGSRSVGEAQSSRLRSQAEYLGLSQQAVLSQSVNFLATTRGTPIEGEESVKGIEALNQASRVYNLTTEESSRAQLALQQIVGKGVVQQEELRGQLAEAIPGATQIAARAYGVTTQELNKMVTSGLDSVEFFRKFTQQLGIETSGGVAGALNTTQASISRFDSNLQKLKETFGSMLLPIQNMGLNVLSTGLNAITASLPIITSLFAALTAKVTIFATRTLIEMITNLIASQAAMGSLGSVVSVVGARISLVAREFLGFAILGAGIANLINQFRDLSGELKTQIDSVKTLQTEYQNLIFAANKVKAPEVNDFDVFKKRLGYAIKEPFTGEVKAIRDSLKTIENDAETTSQILANVGGSQTLGSISQLKLIETQINEIEVKKRALAQNDPSDKEGQRNLNEQSKRLLEQRNQATLVPDNVRKQLNSQAEAVKAQLEYLQKIKKDFPLYGEDVEKVNKRIEALTNDYDTLQSAQEKLVKSIGEGANAFTLMQRNVKTVVDSLSDLNDKNQIAANLIKENLANSVGAGKLSPQQEQFKNQQLDLEAKRQQAVTQRNSILQTSALLSTPDNLQRMQAYGINENTGKARLTTLNDQTTNVQDKFLFEQLGSLQTQKSELSNLRLQLADAQKQSYQQLVDLTKQVADYYKGIDRQAQEQAIEIKKLSLQTTNLSNQNRIKSIFTDGYDTIIGSLVDGIENAVSQFNNASDKALDAQLQALQSKFGREDSTRSGTEIARTIPKLAPIKVDLDFSSIPKDNNVTQLRDDVDATIGSAENLGKSITDVASNTEELNKQLLSNIPPINDASRGVDEIRSNVEKANSETQKAGELSTQWNANISLIPTQVGAVNESLNSVLGTMGNLLTQTADWISKLLTAPNLLDTIGKTINSFFTNGGKAEFNIGNAIQNGLNSFGVGNQRGSQKVILPVNGSVTSGFGERHTGIPGASTFHDGIDLGVGIGTSVKAPTSGVISRVFTSTNGGGNVVEMKSIDAAGREITQSFLHLSQQLVKQGQIISQGQEIAKSGNTGIGSGAHLHWRVHINGQAIDPRQFQQMNIVIPERKATGGGNYAIAANTPVSQNSGNFRIPPGLTSLGNKYAQLAQDPRVQAFLKAIAVAEVGQTLVDKGGGYGKQIGGNYGRDDFNNLSSLTRIPASLPGRGGQNAFGRYQIHQVDFTEAQRSLGVRNLSPQNQDIIGVQRLMMKGAIDPLLKGDLATAIKKAGNEFASLQGSKFAGDGLNATTVGGKIGTFVNNFNRYLNQGQQQVTSKVQTATNNFKPATPQQISQTVQYGIDKAITTNQVKEQVNQQISKLQQAQDSIAGKAQIAKVVRSSEKGSQDNQDKIIAQRRSLTDLRYEAIPYPTIQQQNIKASTDNQRKHEDYFRDVNRLLATELDPQIKQATLSIQGFRENLKNTSLTPDVRKAYTEGITTLIKYRDSAIALRSSTLRTMAESGNAFDEVERTRVQRANYEEYLRRTKESINLQQMENAGLQQRIAFVEQVKQSSPTDPRVENLPELHEQLSLSNLAVESFQKRLDAEEQLKRNGITPEEYSRRNVLLEESNNKQLEGIRILRDREELEQTIAQSKRDLEITSKSTDISTQLGDASLKAIERSQRLNAFGMDTGELARIRTEQATNQRLVLETELKKQIIDVQEFGKQTGLGNEQVTQLIYSLQDLNEIKISNLKTELQDLFDTDKINELTKIKENTATRFSLTNQPGIDLINAKADDYEKSGGNVFVSNARRRVTARDTEMQARSQALQELDIQVAQARQKGIEIADDAVTNLRENIITLSDMKLDKLTDQFKDVRTTLGDIAQQGIGELSSGLSSLIAKGGSFGNVFNNVFGNILDKALNVGISSLFGGLFGGMFATGGIAGKAGYEDNFVGAIANAAQTERVTSGRTPVLIMAHEGELMIPASRLKELTHMGIGAGVLLGRESISNYAFGGVVGESSREYGGSMSSRGSGSVLQVEYKSTEIAGQKYVTESDFQQGLMLAAEEGGKRGATIVTNKLSNSPSYRRSLGF